MIIFLEMNSTLLSVKPKTSYLASSSPISVEIFSLEVNMLHAFNNIAFEINTVGTLIWQLLKTIESLTTTSTRIAALDPHAALTRQFSIHKMANHETFSTVHVRIIIIHL